MSSIFEAPPSRPSGSLFKTVTAFSAGVVVAGAVGTLPGILYGTSQPTASSRQPPTAEVRPAEARRSPAKPSDAAKSTLAESPKTPAQVRETPAQPADAREAEAQTAQTPAIAARPTEDAACEQRTWPYADQKCTEPDTNSGQAARPVRVIPTDRNAPPAIGTAAASSLPVAAASEPKVTGDVAAAASVPPNAAPALPTAPARAAARAADEPAESPSNAAPKAARTAASGNKEARRAKPSEQQRRAAKSRTLREGEGARERDEAADHMILRSHVLPDGRRVTVYRTPNRPDDARAVVRGETYTRREPWPPSTDDDDEED